MESIGSIVVFSKKTMMKSGPLWPRKINILTHKTPYGAIDFHPNYIVTKREIN
jgi:hypothetical protein